ncbi:MAG: phosphatidate cytidylyltransferase [Gemmatimonadetes bacterium]|nr:phosphatidate cytidylyltransferase [Gemmatimonadota bacterium]
MSDGLPTDAGTPAAAREPIHPQPPTPVDAPRERSNLALRLVTAALLIPPVTYGIFADPLWVLGIVVIFILIGVTEFYQLIEAKGVEPLRSFGTAAAVTIPFVVYWGGESAATILLSMVLLGVMVAQLRTARITDSLASISGTFFGVFYVGWLLSHAIALRNFQPIIESRFGAAYAAGIHPDAGAFYLFLVISIVIGGDVGAYFGGRFYGKRKLAPTISPNKTVEGAIGAVIAGVLIGAGFKLGFDIWAPQLSASLGWLTYFLLAPVLAVVGIVGDLVESLLKRDAQVKDTGTLLPGTGGILDRIDSNLLGIPVMYYLLLAITVISGGPAEAIAGPAR